jgi:hypothetical protein
MEQLRKELEEVSATLSQRLAGWPYAFAMAGGCHGGAEHPALRAVRDEVDRLVERRARLLANIAEMT